MTMEQERIDLGALDPTRDQLGYERLIRRIMDAAAPELERRRTALAPLAILGDWARPMLTAAALVGLLAAGVLVATERTPGAPGEASFAEALGVPAPAADWLAEGREPTRSDLVLAMERR